jgi:hypothetical protein
MNTAGQSFSPRDPNLGQKEAEKEQAEFDDEQPVDEEDELEPMKNEEDAVMRILTVQGNAHRTDLLRGQALSLARCVLGNVGLDAAPVTERR